VAEPLAAPESARLPAHLSLARELVVGVPLAVSASDAVPARAAKAWAAEAAARVPAASVRVAQGQPAAVVPGVPVVRVLAVLREPGVTAPAERQGLAHAVRIRVQSAPHPAATGAMAVQRSRPPL
jgi:hypothetical protein